MDLFRESAQILEEENIQYASKISYHQMCRWNSGMFYKHPALEKYRYYWRIEPKVQFFCNVDYDVFRYMEDRNKTYGFTINLYDAPQTIKTLWPETRKFLAANPSYLNENNMWDWITDDQARPEHTAGGSGYSTCHFWSNFEIGDMDFFRGEKYEAYFQHLDRAGGFFYERWGDAPVHSLGIGLFADSNNVHWYVHIRVQKWSTTVLLTVISGSAILVITIFHIITARTHPSAPAVPQASSSLAQISCRRRIVGRHTSSTLAHTKVIVRPTVMSLHELFASSLAYPMSIFRTTRWFGTWRFERTHTS
jgi:hypothetical protein